MIAGLSWAWSYGLPVVLIVTVSVAMAMTVLGPARQRRVAPRLAVEDQEPHPEHVERRHRRADDRAG